MKKRILAGVVAITLLSSMILFRSPGLSTLADTQTVTKTLQVNFSESQQQSQSQTVTIPNLSKVDSVTVNTGSVGYTQNGNQVTVNVSGGTASRTYTPSKTASSSQSSTSNSFAGAIGYNDGTYSGTLYQSGGVSKNPYYQYIDSPSGSFAWSANDYGEAALYAASPPHANDYIGGASGPNPSDWPDEYTVASYYWSSGVSYNYDWGCDFRWCFIQYNHYLPLYTQGYSGTVYAATQYYYTYSVTITYDATYSRPSVTVSSTSNSVQLSWTMADSTQMYKYSVYRKGPSDSGFVKVADSLTGLSWTDNAVSDTVSPGAATVTGISHNADFSQYTVSYTAPADVGSSYQCYVEAVGQTDGTKIQSTTTSTAVTSGVKGYSIIADTSAGTTPGSTVSTSAQSFTFATPVGNGFYVHMCAIDNAGNKSTVTHYHVDDTISVSFPVLVNYAVDPNTGSFIAPDISITNNSAQPVKVSVHRLQAVSGGSIVLHDVMPDKYSDWNSLTAAQTQSDIALGIGIKSGSTSAWSETDLQNPIYAAQIFSDTQFGILKASSTGTLQLTAKYGLAWRQAVTSNHQLELSFSLQ